MKNTFTILCLLLLGFTVQAQEEVRNLSNFNELTVAGGIQVDLIQSGDHKAEITMVKGKLSNLKTEMKGDRLKIFFENNSKWSNNGNNKAKIKLHIAKLRAISVKAGAKVACAELMRAGTFNSNVSSGGSLTLKMEAGSMVAEVSSGGNAQLTGSSGDLKLNASSGGKFSGEALKCKSVKVKASSGGNAKVWVTDSLTANASSGGQVKYKGNPSSTDIEPGKMSGGRVSQL